MEEHGSSAHEGLEVSIKVARNEVGDPRNKLRLPSGPFDEGLRKF